MRKMLLLLTLGLGLWSLDASATTRYVAKTGSNSNTCAQSTSASTPKQTIMGTTVGATGALACMAAGDTLMIRAGTYTESINSNSQTFPAGTSYANAPRIVAYPGIAPYEVVTVNGNVGGGVMTLAHDYIQYLIFEGFIVDGLGSADPLATYAKTNHVRFLNMEFKNGKSIAIGNNGGACPVPCSQNYEYINLTVHNNADHGFYISTQGNLIQGCTIYSNGGPGTNSNWGVQLYNGVNSSAVNNNIVRNNKIYGNTIFPGDGGINISSGSGNQIYNNLIYGNLNGIINFNNGNNSLIYNNTVYNNTGPSGLGFQNQQGSGVIVRNNIFYGNTTNESYLVTTTHDHNLTTDPSFSNAGASDFHLLAGSPAIDVGVDLSSIFTTDFSGATRPFNVIWDEGAYEFNSPDVTSPVISAIDVAPITDVTARVIWTTNEVADTQVEYGLTTGYGSSSTLDATMVTSHVVNLASLTASTLYHYRLKSKDGALNLTTSSDFVFTTAVTPFVITIAIISPTSGQVLPTGNNSQILWTTNDPGNLNIEYSGNNGSDYSSVTPSVLASLWQYIWTIPPGSSSQVKLKLTSLTDPTVIATSSAFKISGNYVK